MASGPHETTTTPRPEDRRWTLPRRLRLLAAVLIGYGLLGLLALLVAALLAAGPLDQLAGLGQALATQRVALVDTLGQTSSALDETSASVQSLHTSPSDAGSAAASAATLSRQLSTTMNGLEAAMGIQILGTRPLAQLQAGFAQPSSQLQDLGTRLDGIGTAIDRNDADLIQERQNLSALRDSVSGLQAGVRDTILPSFSPGAVTLMQIAMWLLVLWLAILALASLVAGLLLWHWSTGVSRRREGFLDRARLNLGTVASLQQERGLRPPRANGGPEQNALRPSDGGPASPSVEDDAPCSARLAAPATLTPGAPLPSAWRR